MFNYACILCDYVALSTDSTNALSTIEMHTLVVHGSRLEDMAIAQGKY